MRLILLLLAMPFALTAQADLETVKDTHWQVDYDSALATAKKEHKNVLVYFTGSDWCHPCKMLQKDFFETDTFKELADNYSLLYVDLPRNKDLISAEQMKRNKDLLPKLNKKGVFPLLKVLNANEVVLGEYAGYGMKGEISNHVALLDKYKAAK